MKSATIARTHLARDMFMALGLAIGAGLATALAAGSLVLAIALVGA
ncbi:MAG: hypothetical protein JNM79_08520 [Burkholderiales bacterium]|nr:hypothetical protein [Burkholderiales bacterium]